MRESNLVNTISFYLKAQTNTNDTEEQLIYKLIKNLLNDKGIIFLDFKFPLIIDSFNKLANCQFSSQELYEKFFPGLIFSWRTTDKVFENIINQNNSFIPLFHSSEYVFREWLINFKTCALVVGFNDDVIINRSICANAFEVYNTWIQKYPDIKGHWIRSNIYWDLGELPLNTPIEYVPKNPTARKDILDQLAKNKVMQIDTSHDMENKILIEIIDSKIILLKKKKFLVTPIALKEWLAIFGITASLTTTTYLLEYGMPYNGRIINLSELLYFTGRGYGIIGVLAFELSTYLKLSESEHINVESRYHPLKQSIIIGFSRLEYYLNANAI